MVAKVTDASAIIAILFGEPAAARIARRLEGAELAAPRLLALEVANACLVKARRQPERREDYLAAFDDFDRIAFGFHDIDAREVLSLADQAGLTAYDASYLWLARALDAELVTLDAKLDAAARKSAG